MNRVYQISQVDTTANLPKPAFNPWLKRFLFSLALVLSTLIAWAISLWAIGSYRVLSDDPTVWQASIDKLNATDNELTPQLINSSASLLFVGSSSIRLFSNLEAVFAPNPVLKKGFGGAKINDLHYYKEDIIFPYQPKVVVLYIGINDILYREYQQVSELTRDLFSLSDEIQQRLLQTQLVLVAQRPLNNPAYTESITTYNQHLANYALLNPRAHYVDINQQLSGANQPVNPQLLHWDGLHLNHLGYQVWGNALYKELKSMQLIQ